MTLRLFAGLLLLFLSGQTSASTPNAIAFFRSPQSLFASGQAPLGDLQHQKKSEMTVNFDWVRKDGHDLRLESRQVLRDLDLSTQAQDLESGQVGKILRASSPWYEWQSPKGEQKWRLSGQLIPVPEDLGLAQVISDDPFRKTTNLIGETWSTARPGERFRVIAFKNDFVQVESLTEPGVTGYLELSHVILKVDFAEYVMSSHHFWRPFLYREGTLARLSQDRNLDLDDLHGILTKPGRGIIAVPVPEAGLMPRSTVEINKSEWVQWALSEVKGHGLVYWKEQEQTGQAWAERNPPPITTEEILQKTFFSVSLHPKHPEQALVSGKGVFLTQDGKNWSRLNTFNNEDLPVAISENGDLFVGTLFSEDHGKNFRPFLRWEDLTTMLEAVHFRSTSILRLTEIRIPTLHQIEISLDTGAGQVRLLGSNRYGLVTDWKILQMR